jgi:ankyrin repeat protein
MTSAGAQEAPRGEPPAESVAQMLEAAADGDAARLRALLAEDPRLAHAAGPHGKTPLHLAAEHDRREVAGILLDAGAPIDRRTDWGMTPLEWAACLGKRDVGAALLARGARGSLFCAAGLGLLDRVRALLRRGSLDTGAGAQVIGTTAGQYRRTEDPADSEAVLSHAFYAAARNGHVKVAACLRAAGADVNHRGFFGAPGLHWAAINGHAAMVAWLLRHRADGSLTDEQFQSTAIGWALEGGHVDIALALVAAGVTPNLFQCARLGLMDRLAALLDGDPSLVNARNEWGTALLEAAHQGRGDVVRLLLLRGADPAAVTSDGETAADVARRRGHAELADALDTAPRASGPAARRRAQ